MAALLCTTGLAAPEALAAPASAPTETPVSPALADGLGRRVPVRQSGFPGALGHEYSDAQQFLDWGVDYLDHLAESGVPSGSAVSPRPGPRSRSAAC